MRSDKKRDKIKLMIQPTVQFKEGNLYLDTVINGQLYSAVIELPQLTNQQQEEQFAYVISNFVKNTMLQAKGIRIDKGLPIIQ